MPNDTSRAAPPVTAVILAYNNLSDTLECLRWVGSLDYANLRVLLVDNGSTDGTAEAVAEQLPGVGLVRTAINLGIPRGFNLGVVEAARGGAEYILLLNNDTTLAPDMLSELVRAAEADPHLGVVMPQVLYYDHPELVWSAGARYRRFPPAIVFIGRGKPAARFDRPRFIEFAPSCGLLVRRLTFETVGLFDPGYLFYYDDWDFCRRVRDGGFGIAYVPRARMWHKVSRTIRARPSLYWRTWGASCARYYRRNGHPAAIALAVHGGYIVARELVKGNGRSLPHFLAGVNAGWRQPLGQIPTLVRDGVGRDV